MISYKDLNIFHDMSKHAYAEGSGELQSYMFSRGMTSEQVETFEVGITSPQMREALEGKISPVFLRWLDKNHIFDDKMVFPIHDTLSRICGLQTRGLGKKTFHKIYAVGAEALPSFLGLKQAMSSFQDQRVLYLTEGIFDFFALQRLVPNVVCVTTASISQAQLRFLARFCSEILVALDMDSVGDKGFRTISEHMRSTSIIVTRLEYPYKDLSEFLERDGYHAFEAHFKPMMELRTLLDDFSFSMGM